MENPQKKIPFYQKRDMQIIGVVLILLVIAMIFAGPSLFGKSAEPNYVIITWGNGETMEVPLGETQIITIEQGNGIVNKIGVEGDGVYMYSSTCANQDCVEQGKVALYNYKSLVLTNWIICLPNRVSVELVVKDK